MNPEQIPAFLAVVMVQIKNGVDRFNGEQIEASAVGRAGYPEYIEAEITVTDESGDWDHQVRVRIPFHDE